MRAARASPLREQRPEEIASVSDELRASRTLDVVAIGNALVDVLATRSDDFVAEHGIVKGAMALVDTERAESIYTAMGPGGRGLGRLAPRTRSSGVVPSLGSAAAFVGRVRDDQLGEVYAPRPPCRRGRSSTPPCAGVRRCPTGPLPDPRDARTRERTLNTYLGASAELGPERRRPRSDRAGARSRTSRATCGTPPRPRMPSGSPRTWRTTPATGRAHAVGRFLPSSGTGRRSSISSRARWTCCSPNEAEISASLRGRRPSTPRSSS